MFQATPQALDLSSELRAGETLTWSVARYGRELHPGDRVYYWQSGRDAGIYGVGFISDVSTRGALGRYTVQTRHDRALFAPITRTELRAEPALRNLAVLRQPRGTVFPLTLAEAAALAQRTGEPALALALPADRCGDDKVRLSPSVDGAAGERIAERRGRDDEIQVFLVADGAIVESRRVSGLRRRRNGDVELRLSPMTEVEPPPLGADVLAAVAGGQAVTLPAPSMPSTPSTPSIPAAGAAVAQEWPHALVAEAPSRYEAARFAPAATEVRGDLTLPASVVAQIVAAINAGRHIVLMGLPGTGKTTLALNVARAAARAGLCRGHLIATGTADWTTFDTIGGLVPSADGTLRFAEGVALRALREDRWLVLDELNRADIDKAFGPLLTVLAGAPVDLPTITVSGRPVRIEPDQPDSGVTPDGATYRVGRRWRIIGTMNTLDRAALFSFSLAFARRFAFVLVPAPDPAAMLALVRERVALDPGGVALVEGLLQASPRPLGPAVLLDTARYLAARAGPSSLVEALGAFVLPQYEGLDAETLRVFARALAPVLGAGGEATLLAYIEALYGPG